MTEPKLIYTNGRFYVVSEYLNNIKAFFKLLALANVHEKQNLNDFVYKLIFRGRTVNFVLNTVPLVSGQIAKKLYLHRQAVHLHRRSNKALSL